MIRILKIILITIFSIVLAILVYINICKIAWFWDTQIDMDDMEYLKYVWKIEIEPPIKINRIINREDPEGVDLEIWYYEMDQIENIANNNKFKKINKKNKESLYEKLKEYYEILEEEHQILFDNNVNLEEILYEENYYVYETDDFNKSTYLILVLDIDTRKLYYFTNIY